MLKKSQLFNLDKKFSINLFGVQKLFWIKIIPTHTLKKYLLKKMTYHHKINILSLFLIALFGFEHAIAQEIITHISVNAEGENGNSHSQAPALSADGRYIAFHSDANNLVPNDNNGFADIFVYDRILKQINRISVNSEGNEGNFVSFFPNLSANGRYVTFQSDASNLVPNDDNLKTTDIFVYDRETKATQIVSVSNKGKQGNSTSSEPDISADGRYIAFHSYATNLVSKDSNNRVDVFLHDLETGETIRVSIKGNSVQAKGASFSAAISADGSYIAFTSEATNLVTDDKNQKTDILVRDWKNKETVRISINNNGEEGDGDSFDASMSADGRYIAFGSRATNLVTNDNNGVEDIFVHDRQMGETSRVSINSQGQQAESASFSPTLSTDGRYVVFNSEADNLVDDDDNETTDVFIHDRQTGQTRRLSLASQFYADSSAASYSPAISENGRWVVFESRAWNLASNDFNEASDIFLYDRSYYASFDVTTEELYIPVVNVPEVGLFKARLTLVPNSTPLQLTVNRVNSFRIPLADIPSIYTPDIRLLQLPSVELINPPFDTILCQVDMVADIDISVLTVIQLNCNQ
ncbi:WD40-like Beta Propeller [Beggiatoa sp. PS]|nr:WD40-like Beta Propeller [Beggiatoa sp. PS]